MKNILYLTHRVPYPPNRGDRIRSYHTLRFLSERYNVHLGCLADEPVDQATRSKLSSLCKQLAVIPLARGRWISGAYSLAAGRSATEGLFRSPELNRTVRHWANEIRFDTAIVFCSSMVQFARVPELHDVPVIVDLVDVDSQKWFDYAGRTWLLKKYLFQLEGHRTRRLESSLPNWAKAILLVSESEADLYREFCPNDRTVVVGNGVNLEYFSPADPTHVTSPHSCIFVGVLDYRANVEGLQWFCAHVWPEVRRRIPDAEFRIVGRRPGTAVRQLAKVPGVSLIGEVPDVRPHIAASAVVVAPLQVARGIQNKVLEAMAMAKPVVASPGALEGLTVQSGVETIKAASTIEQVNAIVRLMKDGSLCSRIGHAGRSHVCRAHSWMACLQPLSNLVQAVGVADNLEWHTSEGVVAT